MLCLKERRLFDGDGGGGGGGDDDAAADAAAEGVGGGTGVGGTATASEAAGGAIGGGIGGGGATTGTTDAMGQPGGFGVGGLGETAAQAAQTAAGAAAQSQAQEDAFGGMHTSEQAISGVPGGVTSLTGQPNVVQPDFVSRALNSYGRSTLAFNVARGLGRGREALFGPGGLDQTADEAVAAQEAAIGGPEGQEGGDTSATPFGLGNLTQGGRLGLPAGSVGGAGTTPGGLPATPQFQRPARLDIPPELQAYLNPGMNDLQLRAAIATGAMNNSNPAYRTQGVKDFYNNLVARTLIDDSGNFREMNEILPIEQQYALQGRGVQPYEATSQSFLQALGAI